MRTVVIIPLYRQAANVALILEGLASQTVRPHQILLVVDRPEDDSLSAEVGPGGVVERIGVAARESRVGEIASVLVSRKPAHLRSPPSRVNGPLFLAGHVRNEGIAAALAVGAEATILLDGDCIPEPRVVEQHEDRLSCGFPVMSVGRKGLEKHGWSDWREMGSWGKLGLFRDTGTVLNGRMILARDNVLATLVFSCSLGLNRSAVLRLIRLNEMYYGRREVFSSEFSGRWGGEDSFLALQSLISGVVICTISGEDTRVRHIDHPPHATRADGDPLEFFEGRVRDLHERIVGLPPTFATMIEEV